MTRSEDARRSLVPSGPGARRRRVVLQHPVFSSFGNAFFRLSDHGRKPALIVGLDDREASLPIDGLMREFHITPESEDGAMLGLVSRALSFVTGLRVGEWLPSEVLTGEASWTLDEVYRERSLGRFNLCLLAWMLEGAPSIDRASISQAGMRPMSAESLASGLRLMTTKVGGVTPDEALLRIRRVAEEFAYIESLRDGLLRGAGRMMSALDRLSRTFRGDATHKEMLSHVRRLGAIGLADLQARFDRVDAEVSDIEQVIANSAHLAESVRRHRDDLYVRCRAWDPILSEWGATEAGPSNRTWRLAHETYRFLAPRFMTVVEWRSMPALGDRGGPESGMAW